MAEKITDGLVKGLRPPQRANAIVYDIDVKGFGARITRAGARSFILNYRARGVERRLTIGSWPDWKAGAAREEARRLKREIDQGRDPMAERHEERATPTLAAFAERYLAEYARPHKKPRTVAEDERNLKLHLLPALGNRKITDIDRADVTKIQASRSDAPINSNRCTALLAHVMSKAEEWGLRPQGSNPCRGAKKYREKHRERFLKADELARLGDALVAMEGKAPAVALVALRLLLLTGARLSEILTLKWDFVDGDRLNLPDSKTDQKVIPLGAAAQQLLASLDRKEGNPYVLPAVRGNGHFVGLQSTWMRIRKAAGLPDVRIHDLRHSFASVAVAGGDSLFLIGKVLGHRQSRTTERYAHVRNDPVAAVADRASGRIAEMLDGRGGGAEEPPRIGRR